MKRVHAVMLCLVAVFAFSVVAASAASAKEPEILFKTVGTDVFPQTAVGTTALTTKLETTKGAKVTCTETHAFVEIGNEAGETGTTHAHLFHWLVLFLNCSNTILGGGACWTTTEAEKSIHIEGLGHLGLAHLGSVTTIPAILLLVGTFTFTCHTGIGNVPLTVTGNVIGELKGPSESPLKVNEPLSGVSQVFKQNTGKQELTTFLLSLVKEPENPLMEGEHLTTKSPLGTEESAEEVKGLTLKNEAGKEIEIELHT